MLNADVAWPGLAQVYRLERKVQWWRRGSCYQTSHEVEFGITSLTRQPANWGIETGSHYRRGVTLKEDVTRFTIAQGARVLALIRQAGFLNAAHLSCAFSLLTTPLS
jgi:hypothetical protein